MPLDSNISAPHDPFLTLLVSPPETELVLPTAPRCFRLLKGGDAAHNAEALLGVLDGAPGPYRDVVIYNAAGALMVAGKAQDLKQGAAMGAEAIDGGKAKAALDKLIAITNEGGA